MAQLVAEVGNGLHCEAPVKIPITVSDGPIEDPHAIATVTADGVSLDSVLLGSLSINWADLNKILTNPIVRQYLDLEPERLIAL